MPFLSYILLIISELKIWRDDPPEPARYENGRFLKTGPAPHFDITIGLLLR
jgi:hypothetical protein